MRATSEGRLGLWRRLALKLEICDQGRWKREEGSGLPAVARLRNQDSRVRGNIGLVLACCDLRGPALGGGQWTVDGGRTVGGG